MHEKIATSIQLESCLRKRMKRLASILQISESELMQQSLEFYISKSDICKRALRKITESEKYVEDLKRANAKNYGSGTIIGQVRLKK